MKLLIKYRWTVVYSIVLFVIALFFLSEKHGKYEGRWLNIISGDGFGYYAYLTAFYNPSGFEFEMEKDGLDYGKYPVHPYDKLALDSNNQRYTKYFPGVALLLVPFYGIAHVAAPVLGYDQDGFSIPYQYAVLMGALCYLFLGLMLLRMCLARIGLSFSEQALVVMGTALCTNLFNYTWNEPSYSHVYVFFAISGILFFLIRFLDNQDAKSFVLLAFFIGLGFIIRPTSLLIVAAFPFVAGSWNRTLAIARYKMSHLPVALLGAGIALFFPVLYLLFNYLQFGEIRFWTYTGESFDFLNPNFYQFLFSYQKGVFVYSPIMFLILPVSSWIFKKDRFRVLSYLGFFLLLTYILSSWWAWSYGGSFGSRPMIDFMPVTALFVGYGLREVRGKKLWQIGLLVFTLLCLFLNLIQNLQYSRNIIHPDGMTDKKYWQVFLKTDEIFEWVTQDPVDYMKNRKIISVKSWQNDFDLKQEWKGDHHLIAWDANSDNRHYGNSLILDAEHKYGGVWKHDAQSLKNDSLEMVVEVSFSCKLASGYSDAKVVLSTENPENQRWTGEKLISQCREKGTWCFVNYQFDLKQIDEKDEKLVVYILHDGRKPLWVDNMNVRIFYLEPRN